MNALVQLAFVVFLAIAVSGCGGYAPYSYWGGNDSGYSDTRLAENRWTVLYRGNQLTDPAKVTDFTLLRAAELTVTNGFRYFVVVAAGDGTRTNTVWPAGARTTFAVTRFRGHPNRLRRAPKNESYRLRAGHKLFMVPSPHWNQTESGTTVSVKTDQFPRLVALVKNWNFFFEIGQSRWATNELNIACKPDTYHPLFFKKETLLENRYSGMLMGFVTIHKGDPIGAAPQPMGVVGMIPLSGGVKDTHAIAQASRSNIGIFINQKDD